MVPIVLHHGIGGKLNVRLGPIAFTTFSVAVERAIASRGHPLIVTAVHPTAGIATRAAQLKQKILGDLDRLGAKDQGVVLIAHSMGGLDARYMISKLDMASRVRALLTISTPHYGAAYADWCREHLGQRLGGFNLAAALNFDIQALEDLTRSQCARFNDAILNMPGIQYFSVTASCPWSNVPPFALHAWKVIQDAQGENDGLVASSSAVWADRLEHWPVNHWHQINRRYVFEKHGIGNIAPHYLRLLDTMQQRGVSMN